MSLINFPNKHNKTVSLSYSLVLTQSVFCRLGTGHSLQVAMSIALGVSVISAPGKGTVWLLC